MSINSLFGILQRSGVPFLNKQFGSRTLPFSLIGSLGGLYTFAGTCEGTEVVEIRHEDLVIRYRPFGSEVTFVHVTNDPHVTSAYLEKTFQHLHMFIVAEFGASSLTECENADKLKTAVSGTLTLMCSTLLESFACPYLTLMAYPVSLFYRDTKLWSSKLDKFLALMDTSYGCVLHGSHVHVISASWQQLPYKECLNLLLLCSKTTLSPERVLKKKPVYLPVSSPNSRFLLVCTNFPPYRVFSLCAPDTEDSAVLSGFNKVFPAKETSSLVREDVNDSLKFDSAVVALVGVRDSQSVVYLSENCPDPDAMRKYLTYSVSRDLVTEDIIDENSEVGEVECFCQINRLYNCHVVSRGGVVVSVLLKKEVSQMLSGPLIEDIMSYFCNKKKQKG